ncbi:putative nucleosome assembly protein [Cavenderia fasciculata]|uniref:Nucleosome assembly protein n=1 Tax=Cavenderia fasciculata TaxID=261658 RepID=F4QAP8_CACFS|nr:putative nucleosome assembly protein [Cavenderia fasciculata]EGG15767.1 putative nucleosome assembly protein [Cavenderia fasciculata]|eukprot:XP_004354514.1 putative nucleosome assembly protein [Cavenderia fasciculata]
MSDEMEISLDAITSTQVLNRVNALVKLQDQHDDLNLEMEKEIKAIEAKYRVLYTPLYEKRSQIVSGAVEPSGDEIAPKEPIEVPDLKSGAEKGIPQFWWTAMKNHQLIGEASADSEHDDDIFAFVSNVSTQEPEGGDEFSVTFTFADNQFFSNKDLTITVNINQEEMDLDSIDVTPIQWKDGKNFTVKKVEKTVKKKGPKGKAASVSTKTIEEKVPSLFASLFLKHELPSAETMEVEDDQDASEIQTQYQCAVILKETIIPNAVEWFLGRASDDDDGFGGQEGYDFDEDMDEDFDDEEDDIPQIKPKSSKNSAAAPQPNNPECKQQ